MRWLKSVIRWMLTRDRVIRLHFRKKKNSRRIAERKNRPQLCEQTFNRVLRNIERAKNFGLDSIELQVGRIIGKTEDSTTPGIVEGYVIQALKRKGFRVEFKPGLMGYSTHRCGYYVYWQ